MCSSDLYHIPHGRANAVLLPAVLREYGSCIAPKLAVLADALSLGGDTVSEKAERMIAAIEAMRDSFDIPSTLPHLSPNDYTEIARRALKEANPTYPVPQCIFRKNCASVPEERSAIPLQTEQSSAG